MDCYTIAHMTYYFKGLQTVELIRYLKQNLGGRGVDICAYSMCTNIRALQMHRLTKTEERRQRVNLELL